MEEDVSLSIMEETTDASSSPQQEPQATLIGKLKALLPFLYNSMSIEEKEAINKSDWLLSKTRSLWSVNGLKMRLKVFGDFLPLLRYKSVVLCE